MALLVEALRNDEFLPQESGNRRLRDGLMSRVSAVVGLMPDLWTVLKKEFYDVGEILGQMPNALIRSPLRTAVLAGLIGGSTLTMPRPALGHDIERNPQTIQVEPLLSLGDKTIQQEGVEIEREEKKVRVIIIEDVTDSDGSIFQRYIDNETNQEVTPTEIDQPNVDENSPDTIYLCKFNPTSEEVRPGNRFAGFSVDDKLVKILTRNDTLCSNNDAYTYLISESGPNKIPDEWFVNGQPDYSRLYNSVLSKLDVIQTRFRNDNQNNLIPIEAIKFVNRNDDILGQVTIDRFVCGISSEGSEILDLLMNARFLDQANLHKVFYGVIHELIHWTFLKKGNYIPNQTTEMFAEGLAFDFITRNPDLFPNGDTDVYDLIEDRSREFFTLDEQQFPLDGTHQYSTAFLINILMEESGKYYSDILSQLNNLRSENCQNDNISATEFLQKIFPNVKNIKFATRFAKFFQNIEYDSQKLNKILKPYREDVLDYADWIAFGNGVTGSIREKEVKFQVLSNLNRNFVNSLNVPEGVEIAILDPNSGRIESVGSGEDMTRFVDSNGRIYATIYNKNGSRITIQCISYDPSTLDKRVYLPFTRSSQPISYQSSEAVINEPLSEEQIKKLQEHLNILAIRAEINSINKNAINSAKTIEGDELIRLQYLQKTLEALEKRQSIIIDEKGNLVWETVEVNSRGLNKTASIKSTFIKKEKREDKRGPRLRRIATNANGTVPRGQGGRFM